MKKVITYGTFDLLHYGHIRLLERAKSLGDYLVVGITADDFDKGRGKINVQQSLAERIESVKQLGIADEIIVEEYEGQKIDDICRMGIDIFTVGSDWVGKFDYLNEYCKVIYLERTKGVSSSEIREEKRPIDLALIGDSSYLNKIETESHYVNGLHIKAISTNCIEKMSEKIRLLPLITNNIDELIKSVDAVYVHANPAEHYLLIKKLLLEGKHVLCESPIALTENQADELIKLSKTKQVVLQECIKTAYSMAFSRMLLLLKTGIIGKIVSVDATCTSLNTETDAIGWNSRYSWGPTALLPVFQILGTHYNDISISTMIKEEDNDIFTKIDFVYDSAVASIKVGKGVKAEGSLIICGSEGYIYVPAPWWKTDYFEIRYEDQRKNKRYFYQLDGDGIRNELLSFVHLVQNNGKSQYIIPDSVSVAIAKVMQVYSESKNVKYLSIKG